MIIILYQYISRLKFNYALLLNAIKIKRMLAHYLLSLSDPRTT